jgi:hypothetical protein
MTQRVGDGCMKCVICGDKTNIFYWLFSRHMCRICEHIYYQEERAIWENGISNVKKRRKVQDYMNKNKGRAA